MRKTVLFRIKPVMKILFLGMSGAFLVGQILCYIVVRILTEADTTSAFISSFLAWVFGVMVLGILGGVALMTDFNLAVSMGHTRRQFMREECMITLLETGVMFLVLYALYRVDLFVLTSVYSEIPIDSEMDMRAFYAFLKDPIHLLLLLAVVVTLRFAFGMSVAYWGNKGWLVWYAAWMLFAVTCSRIAHMEALQSVREALRQFLYRMAAWLGGYFWQCMGIGVCVCILLLCMKGMSRMPVKG